ncbi:homeobox protein NOBOX [Apteryx rowi]|uniref:homeobox protein NOBOX n=1 Tax=Apteryx rowi TaxID=308060 RepID=UPI000E1DDA4E|nr:homeobox protein NOBOX [Apteryx rowi]
MDGAGAEEKEWAPDGLVFKDEKEDSSQNTEHFVVDADPVGEHGKGNNVLPTPQSAAIKEVGDTLGTEEGISPVKEEEENESYCMVQATVSTSQDSAALDCQLNLASVGRQLPDFLSDMNSVPPPPVAKFAQEPTDQSGSHEQCESYSSDGIEKEAKKKKNTNKSGLCPEKTSSVIPGDLSRLAQLQHVCGLATRQSSKCASANTAAQQSYKVSSVLEAGNSHDGAKEKKELLENPEILPVRKKSRTFYSAEQLEELEKMFQEDHYPDNEKRREIAAVVGVTPQRIMVWFQNRRAKWRKTEKLSVKGNKKYSASAVPSGSDSYRFSFDDGIATCSEQSYKDMGLSEEMKASTSAEERWEIHIGEKLECVRTPLLPVPPLPDIAHDQSAISSIDTTVGNYSSLLSGHSALLASSSVSSVMGMVSPCEAVQSKPLSQGNFGSSRMECFPSLPSPPPIRRASLPLSLSFSPHSHIVPLMLDTSNSECSLSGQENGSMDTFTYSIQNQGASSPASCNYPAQLEPAANLETSYYQYSSQSGTYQLPQYPQQHQVSQFHHLPVHLPSNEFSSVCLTPTASTESNTPFLTLAGNSGVVTYGTAGATQGYVQNHMGGEILLQQPSGSSAGITAYQAVPWNDFYMQGAPFSNQLGSRMPFSSTAGHYFTEQISYTQPSLPSSPYFLQVPNGTTLGSMSHTGKPRGVATPDQSSYQNHQTELELTSLAEGEVESSSSKKGESIVDVKDETND